MRRAFLCFGLALLVVAPASAQTIPGLVLILPTSVMDFTPSADHNETLLDGTALVASYRVDYYLLDASGNVPTGAAPAFSTTLGKPTPTGGVIVVPNAFSAIVPDTAYRVRVVAVGPGGAGVSPISVPFGKTGPARAPVAPATPRIGP